MQDAAGGPGAAAPATLSALNGAGRHRKQSWAKLRGLVETRVQDDAPSLVHLRDVLMPMVRAAGLSGSSTLYEVEPVVLRSACSASRCPVDGIIGSSYVASLGADQRGQATLMLSYTWCNTIGDIVSTLEEHCRNKGIDPANCYIWICALCINQHRVGREAALGQHVENNVFMTLFGNQLSRIGKVLVLMSPWHNPLYLTRVWCVFEIFTALLDDSIEVTVQMPPAEHRSFMAAVGTDNDSIVRIYKLLAGIDVQAASASVAADKIAILDTVERGLGHAQLGKLVGARLQRWVLDTAVAGANCILLEPNPTVQTINQLAKAGRLFRLVGGDPEGSLELLRKAIGVADAHSLGHTEEAADALQHLGHATHQSNRGKRASSMLALKRAKQIRIQLGTLESPQGADLLFVIGVTQVYHGKIADAAATFDESKRVRIMTDTYGTVGGTDLFLLGGLVAHFRGEFTSSLLIYHEALRIRVAAGALKTPGAAVLLAFIGDVLQDKGDLQGALQMYQRSQHIREATQTVDSIWGAHQLSQTGSLHLALGDVETAAPLIEQAEQILLQLGLAQTPEPWGTQTRMIVGLLRTAQGHHEAAVTAFEQAKEVATACGNLESRGGALILTGYGVALAAAGDRPMAEAKLREAKRIRENCGILDTGGTSGGHALCQLLQTLERGESPATESCCCALLFRRNRRRVSQVPTPDDPDGTKSPQPLQPPSSTNAATVSMLASLQPLR